MRFFFFLIFLAFLPLRRYVRTFCNSTTHYCLPVASIRRQQQQHIAVVPLSSPPLSRVVRFFAVAIPLFSLVSDTAITLLLYRLLYHCCCFCCVFWYLCVSTPRTRNRKSYDLLVRTTHLPRSSGWKKMHLNFRFLRLHRDGCTFGSGPRLLFAASAAALRINAINNDFTADLVRHSCRTSTATPRRPARVWLVIIIIIIWYGCFCASKWGLTFNQGAFRTYSKRPFTGTLSVWLIC